MSLTHRFVETDIDRMEWRLHDVLAKTMRKSIFSPSRITKLSVIDG